METQTSNHFELNSAGQKILTIIVPTYNAEKFLDKGLTSMILPQEMMEKLEVIIVNDGTPDNSVAVAQKYVDRYPGTFWVLNKENGGHGSGINAGVRAAAGKYFKVIDADDWVSTEALSATMKVLEAEDFDALVQSYQTYDISREDSSAVVHYPVAYFDEADHGDHIYHLPELVEHWSDFFMTLSFHGVTYNTAFYRSLNYELVEKVFYEDQEYATIPLCNAGTIRLLPDELYIYRIGDVNQSVSAQSMIKRLPHFLAVLRKELDYLPNRNNLPEGGYEYYLCKLNKFMGDIYRVMLIRPDDKKKYRKDAKDITAEIKSKCPDLYRAIRKKYMIFRILNKMHMSDADYEKKILKQRDRTR